MENRKWGLGDAITLLVILLAILFATLGKMEPIQAGMFAALGASRFC